MKDSVSNYGQRKCSFSQNRSGQTTEFQMATFFLQKNPVMFKERRHIDRLLFMSCNSKENNTRLL